MLALDRVSKRFGGLAVLEDVSFAVPAGSVFGLIGPNGAGKTTVFNLVTGLLAPSSGSITLNDQALVGRRPHRITRLGVARTFQNIRVFKGLTLRDNVIVGMHSHLGYGVPQWLFSLPAFRAREARAVERAEELLSWVGLPGRGDAVAQDLSYGDQRKLELARALATEPRLLLLDEPVAGMNSGEKQELMVEIGNIAARGYTILLIEHDMRFVMGLCSRIAVLNFGRIIAEGSPETIRSDPAVIEAYLGRDE
ncbi:MAG TPA: ABC transporter ATP-binding protein [Caldimonas sp.]|nr:ABC transporter ATP-binding protein [Caldimonas sp.]